MSKRKNIPTIVKRAVDGYCKKCGVVRGEYHHIQAVSDGGQDTPENLVMLCTVCHREWHMLAEGKIALERWLVFPPAMAIVYALAMEEDEDFSSMTVLEFMWAVRELLDRAKSHLEAVQV